MQGFAQGWRSDPAQAGGGNTIDGGTHWVRALRVWMGEVDRLVAINERPFKASRLPSPLAPAACLPSALRLTASACVRRRWRASP